MEISDLNLGLLQECAQLIKPYISRTPVMNSRSLNSMLGGELYFKCENFQRTGSYKMRGATHGLLKRSQGREFKDVVTHSSGNFAQAIALAARELGIRAHIVMPTSAPKIKKEGVMSYEAQIYECEPTLDAREAAAKRIVEETGAEFIHPSNDVEVILGQGTAAMELLEDFPELDYLIAPVGGGGLLGGTGFAVNCLGYKTAVYGAEPKAVDDAYRSFHSGRIQTNRSTDTIADGLKTQLGTNSFPLIRSYVSEIILVTENEIIEALRLIWERMKLVVEPSSAVALAAVLKSKSIFVGSRTGIIISGGNVDLPFP